MIETPKMQKVHYGSWIGGLFFLSWVVYTNLPPLTHQIRRPLFPDVSKCYPAQMPNGTLINCCPPAAEKIIDFKLPPQPQSLRIRQAAHLANAEYIAKFSKGIELMKALPKDDPRNFMQQANVHCAYCNYAYRQLGFPDLTIDIHNSWFFFPFHRWYLYFFEKILGNLIDDPTFALPFWNYDSPAGMQMPLMFKSKLSPLYDQIRNPKHFPPTIMDIDFDGIDSHKPDSKKIKYNLAMMYRQMISPGNNLILFFGSPYRAGEEPDPGIGYIENIPHNSVHTWAGDLNQPQIEDMGTFYSAARDPLFYPHHANLDRLWTIWKALGNGTHQEFNDPDWLDSSFLFYNENKELVRVTIRDSLDTTKLGYNYQYQDIPWINSRPVPRVKSSNFTARFTAVTNVVFPVTLNKGVKVFVNRPKKLRSKAEKEQEQEILLIEGIEYSSGKYVKFNVYINDDDENGNAEPDNTEFAGSFVSLPQKHKHLQNAKTSLRLGITQILEDLEVEEDDKLLVTLVPKSNAENVIVAGVRVSYIKLKSPVTSVFE